VPSGNREVVAALKSSDQKGYLHADVAGDREGDTLKVAVFKLR